MSNLHYFQRDWVENTDASLDVDVCVYGGTAGGVVAAVKAARLGKSVVLCQPGKHLGGMTTGGLGWTDFGRKHVIGGMSRQFYRDVGRRYGQDEQWRFEPSKARAVIDAMVEAAGVPVRLCQYLHTVAVENGRIVSITMLGGLTVRAKVYIDATYEGDLLAGAGVSYHVGREANAVYDEKLNGIQVRDKHQFSHPVDPYVVAGDASSGLLPFVEDVDQTRRRGEGDRRVQAYNFRVCMTDDPALKIDWPKPDDFDERLYVLATRWFNSEKDRYNEQVHSSDPAQHLRGRTPSKFDIFPNKTPGGFHKTDTNNHGPVSSDFIGASWDWPDGCHETREKLFQKHVSYQMGLYWHMANSPDIPRKYRDAYAHWGLPRDEFVDTAHWPHQLYVREARRMIGDYVITEHDCTGDSRPDDPVGMGSYTMDSHNCTRFVARDADTGRARVLNDGDVQVPPTDPYPISYRAIVPKRGQCANLIVPTCFSASHIAFGSARMEPVFMVLGESAAFAAALAVDNRSSVQDVPYDELGPELLKAGQILELPADRG